MEESIFRKGTYRIWLTLDLIVLGGSCLVDHNTTKYMLILALQCHNQFLGLIRLEVHFQVIDDVGIWRCGKTEIDFGVRVV